MGLGWEGALGQGPLGRNELKGVLTNAGRLVPSSSDRCFRNSPPFFLAAVHIVLVFSQKSQTDQKDMQFFPAGRAVSST